MGSMRLPLAINANCAEERILGWLLAGTPHGAQRCCAGGGMAWVPPTMRLGLEPALGGREMVHAHFLTCMHTWGPCESFDVDISPALGTGSILLMCFRSTSRATSSFGWHALPLLPMDLTLNPTKQAIIVNRSIDSCSFARLAAAVNASPCSQPILAGKRSYNKAKCKFMNAFRHVVGALVASTVVHASTLDTSLHYRKPLPCSLFCLSFAHSSWCCGQCAAAELHRWGCQAPITPPHLHAALVLQNVEAHCGDRWPYSFFIQPWRSSSA